MSQENVEIVHRVIDAWNRQDIEGILALTDPEAEYVNAPTAVEPGTRRGHEGLFAVVLNAVGELAWWASRKSIDLRIVARRSSASGVCLGLMPGSDARIDNPILLSWKFRDGRVIRLEMLGAGLLISRSPRSRRAAGVERRLLPFACLASPTIG